MTFFETHLESQQGSDTASAHACLLSSGLNVADLGHGAREDEEAVEDVVPAAHHGVRLVKRNPLSGWKAIVKELEDKILGFIALVLFAPLMLLIAAAIKIDDRGSVFFRQRRNGYNDTVFSVWKFRTMTVMEDDSVVVQACANDPRVTRVGRILRRTSLDELPQLFNVVLGEMSLVGPRPHAVSHNDRYSTVIKHYRYRHTVKPGITGWAQISGYRGPTTDDENMRKRVELDLYYIQHLSLWFDLKILLLTPLFGFINRNAL